MTVQVEFWTLVGFLITFIGTICGMAKWIFTSAEKRMLQRLGSLESTLKGTSDNWLRLERDLNALKAELPISYVRKEDYIRGQTTIEAKLDAVYSRLDSIHLRQQLKDKINDRHD